MAKRNLLVISGIVLLGLAGLIVWAKPSARPRRPQNATPSSSSANLRGQTATLLPDGTVLLLGGEGANGPVPGAAIQNPQTGKVTPLSAGLLNARAWQTATVLPDGTVLIFGGIGGDGNIVQTAESFDPATKRFTALPPLGSMPRAHHTATLLTDGTVFITGGVDDSGQTLGSAQVWNPRATAAENVAGLMNAPRKDHTAALQPDGTVLLWGGTDETGSALNYGEIYDPAAETFRIVSSRPAADQGAAQVAATIPEDGSGDVPSDSIIAIRFSAPILMQSADADTIAVSDPDSAIAANVVPAEAGMLAFVTPQESLASGTTYTVEVSGVSAGNGSGVASFTFTFTTAGEISSSAGKSDSSAGVVGLPTSASWSGGPENSPYLKLSPLQAPSGETAISGQVLLQSGLPLQGVTLRAGGNSTQTDATGRFLVTGVSPGRDVLVIDGRSANNKDVTYGVFEVGVDVSANKTNILDYTSWMPVIDTAHAVTISVPTAQETIITNPLIPGLEFHLPAGATVTDVDGKSVNQISITPIPVAQPPFPLPKGAAIVPPYFTIQPGGGVISVDDPSAPKGGWIVHPNTTHHKAGTPFKFWHYDPQNRGWYVHGSGSVTADATSVAPDSGVVFNTLTGSSTTCAPLPYDGPNCCGAGDGDPVDLGTGLFMYRKTDLYVPDVIPIDITRVYRQSDPISRDFGVGAWHQYDTFVGSTDSNNCSYYDLFLPGFTRIHYTRYTIPYSSQYPCSDPVPYFQCNSCPGEWFGSTLYWSGNGGQGWVVYRRDGMIFTFVNNGGNENGSIQSLGLASIEDANGNILTITRDQNFNITQITSPNGRYVQFSYDSSYRLTQIQDSFGRTVQYSYDSNSCLTQVVDAKAGIWKYAYESGFNGPCFMTTITDPRNITYLTNQYDSSQWRVVQQTQADGGTYKFNYVTDPLQNILEADVTDPLGNVRKVTFNSPPLYADGFVSGGTPASDTLASGGNLSQPTTNQYDPVTNLLLSTTDALSRTTSFTYDSVGDITSVTRLSGTPNQVTTTYTYQTYLPYPQAFTRLASITDPLGNTTQLAYDVNGNLISRTDPLGNTASFSYDAEGRVISRTDPAGQITRLSYDGADLAQIVDPLGRTTTFSTGLSGMSGVRFVMISDSLGHATQYQYNALDQLTGVVDPMGSTTALAYDGNGNLLSITDPNSHTTQYTYDNMDRLFTRKDALQNSESYQYDADGNLTQFTDRRGEVTTYHYDGLNRRTFAGFNTQPGPTYESTTSYNYDGADRLTQAVDSIAGTFSRSYDGLDHLTQEITPEGSVNYTYDAAGRRTALTVAGQPTISYSHDNANRLIGITQGATTASFAYDAANRRTSLTLPNSQASTYTYDAASQLAAITYTSGQNALGNLTYGYDMAGRRTTVGGSFAAVNLPLPISMALYNADNQLTQWGTASPLYDANGNTLSDGTNTYVWDGRNQLISMNSGADSFQYDPFGRRVAKTTILGTTNYLYDGTNPVQELSGATPIANILTGLRVDEYLQRTDASGPVNFLADALGSTVALADSNSNIVAHYIYEPFGNTFITGSSSSSYQYAGRENDGTGVYFYRSRYYSPTLERFVSEDPMGFLGSGPNLYSYVRNDPVIYADPSGRSLSWVHFQETFNAGMAVYGDPSEAYALGLAVALVDAGTQGTSWKDTRIHAMGGRKDDQAKTAQTCEQAYCSTSNFVARVAGMRSFAGDAGAIHAIQDSFASGHQYQFWDGHLTWAHFEGDLQYIPAAEAATELYLRTNGSLPPNNYLFPNPCP